MPQYGKSDPVVINQPWLGFNAKTLKDMIDALDIPKVTLIGNSMGGGTSCKFAIEYPDRVDRLVIMDAAGHGPSLFVPSPMDGIRILMEFYDNPSKEAMRRVVQALSFDSSFLTEELLEERFKAAMNQDILDARKKSVAPLEDISMDLDKIQAKTLIIWGRDDRAVSLDHALSFEKRIPDARLFIFPRCGHWAQLEHAEEFDRLVVDFLTH